jgi:predicted dehydrogenase
MSTRVKIALVGLGNIGAGAYAPILKESDSVEVVGVCDLVKQKADTWASALHTTAYYDHRDLLDKSSSGLEAIIVAVPHYDHVPISIDAFQRGVHVLCEKPLAAHVNDARKIVFAWEKAKEKRPRIVFGIAFQQRALPRHRKLKEILQGGELGRLLRVTWINTAWFRSQAYYDSGDWRATWAGEGGGILTNQCPHDLDLYQWLFGMPSRISGHAHIGKYHDIEVEDEVTAYFEHDNGMVGHFIVNTAESPGTNRMEIVGENGTLVMEKGTLALTRNSVSILKFCRETNEPFGKVDTSFSEIPVDDTQLQGHPLVVRQFVQAIHGTGELVVHGVEGLNGLSMANAIMLSSFNGRPLDMPLNADEYEQKLKELARTSRYKKQVRQDVKIDIARSFAK